MKVIRHTILPVLLLLVSLSSAEPQTTHSAKYFNHLAIKAAEKEDFSSALAYLDQALQLDPAYAYTYLNFGIIYKRKGDYDLAIKNLQKASDLNPDLPEVYANLGAVYQKKGDYDAAVEYSQKALSLKTDDPLSIYNLGYAYLLEDDLDSAIEQYDKLKEMNQPELADKLLGKITQKKGTKK